MRSRVGVLAVTLLLVLGVPMGAFAQDTPRFGGVLRVGTSTDIVGLDPHREAAWASHDVLRHVYEGLVALGEDLGIIPQLAESWDISDDGRIYRFKLREGVKFHNLQEVTAEDAVFSLKRYAAISPRSSGFDLVEQFIVKDRYTFEMHLKEPYSPMLNALATFWLPAIIPADSVALDGRITHPIGTGPFEFVEWEADRHVILKRFEQYEPDERFSEGSGNGGWRIAYVDEVHFIPISDPVSRVQALLVGDVDVIRDVPGKDIETLNRRPDIVAEAVPGTSFQWVLINMNEGRPLADVRLRRAIAHAIDPEEIIEGVWWGYGLASPSVYTNTFWETEEHRQFYEHDITKARALMAEAGYDGREIVIATTSSYDYMDQQGVILQAMLQAAGFNAVLEYMDWARLLDVHYKGEGYDLMSFGSGLRPDPDEWYYQRFHSDYAYAGFQRSPRIAEYDRLTEEARRASDPEKRRALYAQAQKILVEELPAFVVGQRPVTQAWRSDVKGVTTWFANGIRYWNVWLDR